MRLTELQRGLTVYGGIFLVWLLALELPSRDVLGLAPWPSTTLTIRDAIQWWHPIALMIAFLFFILYLHFDKNLNVWYLIGTGALTVLAVLIHYFIPG